MKETIPEVGKCWVLLGAGTEGLLFRGGLGE